MTRRSEKNPRSRQVQLRSENELAVSPLNLFPGTECARRPRYPKLYWPRPASAMSPSATEPRQLRNS